MRQKLFEARGHHKMRTRHRDIEIGEYYVYCRECHKQAHLVKGSLLLQEGEGPTLFVERIKPMQF